MDANVIGYLAGFIDGEGCISITRRNKNRRSGYTLTLSASQLDPKPLYRLQQVFGGSLKQYKHKNSNSRPYYMWSVSSQKAVLAIATLLPYLLVKNEQARLGLVFAETITAFSRDNDGTFTKLSDDIIAKREGIYKDMRELKRLEW